MHEQNFGGAFARQRYFLNPNILYLSFCCFQFIDFRRAVKRRVHTRTHGYKKRKRQVSRSPCGSTPLKLHLTHDISHCILLLLIVDRFFFLLPFPTTNWSLPSLSIDKRRIILSRIIASNNSFLPHTYYTHILFPCYMISVSSLHNDPFSLT